MDLRLVKNKIHEIRNQKVILDFDLAEMQVTETRVLKQAVRRNIERFPDDFMFQLKKIEWNEVITTCDNLPKNIEYIPSTPFAFTEQGVAMLASVLKSKKVIQVNILIIKAFVIFRPHLSDYRSLQAQIAKIENEMNIEFNDLHQALNYLFQKEKKKAYKKNERKQDFDYILNVVPIYHFKEN